MRYFRHLPLFLRVADILGLVFALAGLVLLLGTAVAIVPSFPRWPVDAFRAVGIALNLVILSGACTFVVNLYTLRFRRPGRAAYPFDSWQSQMRWMLLLAVLPLCGVAIAIVVPITALLNFFLVVPPTMAALLVYLAAWAYAAGKWQALS